MQELIKMLNDLANDETVVAKEWLTGENKPEAVKKIVSMANKEMITDQGQVSYYAIDQLKYAGYKVTAGERDGFGWLSGVIHTPKGKIVFG